MHKHMKKIKTLIYKDIKQKLFSINITINYKIPFMKNLKLAFVAIALTSLLACEKESVTMETEMNSNLELNIENNTNLENAVDQRIVTQQRSSSLEIELNSGWTGYVLSKMLRHDESNARSIVATELSGLADYFALEEILGSGGDAAFINTFRTHIAYYITGAWPDPDDEKDKPGFPLGANPPNPVNNQGVIALEKGLDGPDPNSPEVQEFMDIMLVENCIELYFPNNMSYNGSFEITSVSHPLNTNSGNTGIVRYFGLHSIAGGFTQTVTEILNVDPAYVTRNDNIIVVRPYKVPLSSNCAYPQYELNFRDFLD